MKWDEILAEIQGSFNEVVLEREGALSLDMLRKMGIPEASTIGQVMLNMRRLIVSGYLRVHGSEIPQISEMVKKYHPGNKIVVATDIWGGIFAIGNGDFSGDTSIMWYYAPETLQWESMDITYAEFIPWVFTPKFEEYHMSFMWKDMEEMLETLSADQGVLIYPFLWSKECNLMTATKKAVPMEELIALNADYEKKLYGEPKKKPKFPFFWKKK